MKAMGDFYFQTLTEDWCMENSLGALLKQCLKKRQIEFVSFLLALSQDKDKE